jgi:preprotein translocase subunit YajC
MDTLATLVPLLLMFVLFYFLLIRPQQKRQKAIQHMQNDLQKGDRIITIGGMHGIIDAIEEGTIIVKCGDGSRLTYDRNAVREVVKA